ncbi:Asparagine synthetase (glutamine-hydrolyzing) [Rubrivivax sp. A210]|uniref:asparagine synthase (glutamine-hydrolyzing) n=1 Tax=Rubrivivax sp. A210 TaxID=2772301 RepID=UPI001918C5E6|nr:asparagine synthase (glutamine-hydrolyzing) [Rubrivivax sp. A210]CAD5370705.1 Asparagine synthetase (glutamine-hydrolyzing) [Rubrivivax sp. A210]
MCGITGFLGGAPMGAEACSQLLERMATRIAHRGPDSSGVWFDLEHRIGLGHRRLSVVDLSPAGAQPMVAASGRYTMVLNGEIYNHLEMRAELQALGQAPAWRGHSDTESLLAAIDAWGLDAAIERTVGMFALAVWDRQRRELALVRDRLGEKPLYYGWQGSGAGRTFLFGSELKALAAHPAFAGEIDRSSVCLLLRHSYIPAPWSINLGVSKLLPGSILRVTAAGAETPPRRYWNALEVARTASQQPLGVTPVEAVDGLEQVLRRSISGQMMADVPLGAFLSGGIDSTTVVALMQSLSSRPVRTFTIGSDDARYDESEHAAAVARHLGTDHTALRVTAADALATVPRLASAYCEPFADSSQIPTLLVSGLARQQVTVALSGDGADELFGGYTRYRVTASMWRRLSRIPRPLRRAAGAALGAVSPAGWDRLRAFIPGARHFAGFGDKVHKGAVAMDSPSADELFRRLVSTEQHPEAYVVGGREHPTLFSQPQAELAAMEAVPMMMALDAVGYLPDDIMAKVDRASMAVSLETRAPYLDHRVYEYAWRLPLDCKLRDGQTKWALRRLCERHVPRALLERPKRGFSIPIDAWLRGPLKPWADALLDPVALRRDGLLEPAPVQRLWSEHLSGTRNHSLSLWNLLMLQEWVRSHKALVA